MRFQTSSGTRAARSGDSSSARRRAETGHSLARKVGDASAQELLILGESRAHPANLVHRPAGSNMAKRRRRSARGAEGGRTLGPRARATRERLLEATAALLRERGLRGASVAEIARRAGTSAATFYQYFEGVDAATLDLVHRAGEGVPPLLEIARGSFAGEEGVARARNLVTRFLDLWDAHHAVLRIRDHAAEEGDRRFRRERREAIRPLLDALAARVPPQPGDGFHPAVAAAAIATVLESAGAHHRELAALGIPRDALIETSARLLVETLS